jgi:hypothetical protein
MGRRNPNRIPTGIRPGVYFDAVKHTADPLAALTQAYAHLFVLILPVPLKRTRLGQMKIGTLLRSNQNHALCSVAVEFVSHLEPPVGCVEGCGNRFSQRQRRGLYRLGHRHPAPEEIDAA